MELKQLSYFLQICKSGSFSAAANHLFITQQGLSMAIARLEAELGCALFVRSSRKLELTPDGIYLQEKATNLLTLADECTNHFDKLYRQTQTINLISGVDFLGILPLRIQKILQNRDPQFSLKLQLASGIKSEEILDQGICNLGFICGPIDEKKYHAHLLMQRNYSYIVNVDNPLARYPSFSFDLFRDQPLIFPGPETKVHHEFLKCCAQHGFKPNIVFESAHQSLVYNMVKRDPACIGQVLDYFTENLKDPMIRVLNVSDCDMRWRLFLVWRRNHILTPKEKAFVHLVLDSVSSSGN